MESDMHTKAPKDKSYKCPICGKAFKYPCLVKKHMNTHATEKNVRCPQCPKIFTHKARLQEHLKNHINSDPVPCSICSKIFRKERYLKDHMKIHSGENLFPCELCGKIFRRRTHMKTHIERFHNVIAEKFICNQCGRDFLDESSLNGHYFIHTDTTSFKCYFCFEEFQNANSLKDHLPSHKSEKPFECRVCPKAFYTKSELKIHDKSHTYDATKCSYCDRTYIYRSDLRNHTNKHHRGLPLIFRENFPVSCTVCNTMFDNLEGLKNHVSVHSDERPLKCDVCDRKFIDKDGIRRHIKTVHNKKAKRIFPCPQCQKSCRGQKDLQRHQVTYHSNDKPFQCNICSRSFKLQSFLHNHMITHKKDEPGVIKCPHCRRIFTEKDIFEKHVETSHKDLQIDTVWIKNETHDPEYEDSPRISTFGNISDVKIEKEEGQDELLRTEIVEQSMQKDIEEVFIKIEKIYNEEEIKEEL